MTLSIISHDGYLAVGAGLSLEELIELEQNRSAIYPAGKPVGSRPGSTFSLQPSKQTPATDGNGRNSRSGRSEKVEIEAIGTVIAKGKNVIISEYNGAIVVQQRYVKKRTVTRNILVKRKGEAVKETITQKITEKPYTVMIPEIYTMSLRKPRSSERG